MKVYYLTPTYYMPKVSDIVKPTNVQFQPKRHKLKGYQKNK